MTRRSHRSTIHLGALAAVAALTLAACGDDDDTSSGNSSITTAPATPTQAPATTATPAGSGPLISLADTSLGQVVVAADGLALYLFTPDSAGDPTCIGECATNWPPYIVPEGTDLTAGDGIDPALLSLVPYPAGGNILKLGDWPLYHFAGDSAPGDVNGQEKGDVWYVVDATGNPVE